MKAIQLIIDHKEAIGAIGLFLYETLVRLKPTAKDWSIINIAKRLFDIIPNKASGGDIHK